MNGSGHTSIHEKSFKSRLLKWMGFNDDVTIKVYHGYGHGGKYAIYGHVFRFYGSDRKTYRKHWIYNSTALFRMFMVRPFACLSVTLNWYNNKHFAETDEDGFFKFEWYDPEKRTNGWHEVTVNAQPENPGYTEGKGLVYIPHETQYGFISDIDDTFLISHSSNLRKRLYVLFSHNARSRKPFESAVLHYQLLAKGNAGEDSPNPFFYVSSSEWNLYDYIIEFIRINGIPQGVLLLNRLKRFTQLFKTGQNNHRTKFIRIAKILEHYPEQKFILLGDSSQQDPYIYEALASHFPKQVFAVYIRDISKINKEIVAEIIRSIHSKGVHCCFFAHSSEAIDHSKRIGLIPADEINAPLRMHGSRLGDL